MYFEQKIDEWMDEQIKTTADTEERTERIELARLLKKYPVKGGSFVVFGEPNAQKRHRHASRGKFVQTYDPSKDDKADFRVVAQQQAPSQPFSKPLFVEIVCYFSRPKSHFGTGRNSGVLKPSAPFHHTKKPDADNCVKFVLDALNGIFWTDDSIIAGHRVHKAYCLRPRTEVQVFEMETPEVLP